MTLKAGIVGLPNVGKSTLFNAVTRTRKAQAANYPFCTIDPNVGVVTVPDERLYVLQKIAKTGVVIPATIEFVDIAGLVKGAATGRRARQQVPEPHPRSRRDRAGRALLRGRRHPPRHRQRRSGARHRVINTELMLADLESVEKRIDRQSKQAKRGDKEAIAEMPVLAEDRSRRSKRQAGAARRAHARGEAPIAKHFFLLTDKPTIFACNVKDIGARDRRQNPYVQKVRDYAKSHLACEAVVISAQIESDLVDLARGREGVPEGPGRAGKRRRLAHPRHLPPARPAHLLHGRREGSARLDDPHRRHGPEGGRRHPFRLRARLHQGRNRGLRGPRRLRLGGGGAREGSLPDGRQGVRRERRRRAALQVQRGCSAGW
jgi:hypothetical protein